MLGSVTNSRWWEGWWLAVTGLAYRQEGAVDLRRGSVTVLVSILAALAVTGSLVGLVASDGPGRHTVTTARGAAAILYGEGLYAADTWLVGIGNRGQDGAILLVEVPILLLALRWYRCLLYTSPSPRDRS